jgi:hypothetical protein
VWAFGYSNSHTDGLDDDFSVDDNASTNTIVWTEVASTTRYDHDEDSRSQLKLFLSSELTANETFTVTADFDDQGTSTYLCGALFGEVSSDSGSVSVVQSDPGGGLITSPDIVFGSTPASYQLVCWYFLQSGTATLPAEPAGFTDVAGASSTGVEACQLMESSSNTTATISYAPTSSGSTFGYHAIGVELTDVAETIATAELASGTGAAADAATAVAPAAELASGTGAAADGAITATTAGIGAAGTGQAFNAGITTTTPSARQGTTFAAAMAAVNRANAAEADRLRHYGADRCPAGHRWQWSEGRRDCAFCGGWAPP